MGERESRLNVKKILEILNPKEEEDKKLDSTLIYNVIGFLPVSDFTDNGMLISNIGYLIAEKNLNVCILDLNVFYPSLYNYLDIQPNEKGYGLLKILKDDKADIRNQINVSKYKQLYLVSASPYDLIEDYLDFSFDDVKRVIDELKDSFDIVLIDIPNNPPLEFCLAAMKYVHRGFITAGERLESIPNSIKLLNFVASLGITTSKFTNLIFTNTMDINYDYGALKDSQLTVVANLPLVKQGVEIYLEGGLYCKDSALTNKQYMKNIKKIVDIILE